MEQLEITINDVKLPIIKEKGVKYYPISYLGSKILLKDLKANQLIKNGYGQYFKKFNVNFKIINGGIQNTYCISENGLKEILKNSKIGRLSVKQRKSMNNVLKFLNMETIPEDKRFIKAPSQEEILNYPEYIQDCINDVLQENNDIMWQRCTKCNNYYPYHINFFRENPHSGKDYPLYTICRDCKWTTNRNKDWIRRNDRLLSSVFKNYGLDTYRLYKKNDIIGIYKDWINKQYSKSMPKIINNKESYLIIIKYLFDTGKINANNLIIKKIVKKYNLYSLEQLTNMDEIYKYLFQEDHLNYPWKYPHYKLSHNMSFNQYKKIFNNYIHINNIKIKDIYNFDYVEIFKKCRIYYYLMNDILKFIMNYYDNKYPAYKFKIKSVNYWKDKNNRVQALKYLIEEDMKIPLEKVPLYLTLETIRKKSNTMRNLLRKYYDNNLWNWVDEVYPNKFIEEDFNITVIRNVFDSAEEHIVHDVLTDKFDNVIYNQRNTKNTIKISGMQPDWFIFTDNGIWVVEYFGISVDTNAYNKRTHDYKKRALEKIEKYNNLNWLNKIYVYPDDLKDNFKGLEGKLKAVG